MRLGVIGCGEISQVAHIPMLNLMSDNYRTTYLCDISKQALEHCASRVAGTLPKVTTNADELCSSPDVDAVIVCNATAFHHTQAILALQHDKHVFVEKPLALSYRDLDALQAAEDKSKGVLFVGYMRRYAPAFLQAIAEVWTGAEYKISDFGEADSKALKAQDDGISQHALVEELGVPLNNQSKLMLLNLGGLGSQDLLAMREAIGMPQAVIGADLRLPIWSAMLRYNDFTVVYESGINSVPVFDAHIEIYTKTKIVRINYDTPYVKGLPTTLTVREKGKDTDTYQERTVRPTYEDSCTIEFKGWHQYITEWKTPNTTITEARQDMDILKMLMQSAFGKESSQVHA